MSYLSNRNEANSCFLMEIKGSGYEQYTAHSVHLMLAHLLIVFFLIEIVFIEIWINGAIKLRFSKSQFFYWE